MAVLGLLSVRGLSLVVASGGHSSSRCAGLSLSWPLLLQSTGSRFAGSVVVAHGPSCSAACGIFPDQGSNPCPLHWQADSQPLRHQGSPAFLELRFLCYSRINSISGNSSLPQFTSLFRLAILIICRIWRSPGWLFSFWLEGLGEQRCHSRSRENGRSKFERKNKFSFRPVEFELAKRYPIRSFHGKVLK